MKIKLSCSARRYKDSTNSLRTRTKILTSYSQTSYNSIPKSVTTRTTKSRSTKINKSYLNYTTISKSLNEMYKTGRINIGHQMPELENCKMHCLYLTVRRIRYPWLWETSITSWRILEISTRHLRRIWDKCLSWDKSVKSSTIKSFCT